jgi:hypothetical protein
MTFAGSGQLDLTASAEAFQARTNLSARGLFSDLQMFGGVSPPAAVTLTTP